MFPDYYGYNGQVYGNENEGCILWEVVTYVIECHLNPKLSSDTLIGLLSKDWPGLCRFYVSCLYAD
jgi:hypothetical protein